MIDLASLVALGASATRSIEVTHELTVQHAYAGLPAVYATPQMILLMEMAAADAIAALLPAGWVSVGTRVDVRHLAATPVGERVTATARVVEVGARHVRFACEAHDEHETIGDGWHERAPVDLARFVQGIERRRAAR
ncbi:MAG: thioesterase [Gammaproteobacteria bacterium]|nr:thioesterase [Gammaproteobacteria bacterium]MCP5198431.1 thioesterase [Gammaproteobacteria bacterium]